MLLSGVNSQIRGNSIGFTVTFTDANNLPVSPVSVNLTLAYMNYAAPNPPPATCGTTIPEIVRQTLPMTLTGPGTFFVAWDSSVAGPGKVSWVVQSQGPEAAWEGFFLLEANLANVA